MPSPNSTAKATVRNSWQTDLLWLAGIFLFTGTIEYLRGSLPLGVDGKFGWWEGNIWSNETSQRFADPYSLTHLTHGILLFCILRYLAPRLPASKRLLIAALIEGSWELVENSLMMIDRYRAVTISLGYSGDSILNSMSDILMMCLGFAFAMRVSFRVCIATVLILEIGCALWVHDNLTLNVIMLIHPIEAIKHWQMAGAPAGLSH